VKAKDGGTSAGKMQVGRPLLLHHLEKNIYFCHHNSQNILNNVHPETL
jgi:hypothetical protein